MTFAPPRLVLFAGLIAAAAAVVIAATLIGFAGRFWWPFDLLSHFRVQYAASLSAAAVALWCLKRRKMAAFAAAFAAVNLLCISWYLAPSFRLLFPLGPRIRVASINVLTSNTRADEVLRFIEDAEPDVVFLMEVDDRWVDQLAPLQRLYPHRQYAAEGGNFGAALLSKRPLSDGKVLYLGPAQVPSIMAAFEVDGERLTLLGTHPLPPTGRENTRMRDRQLEAVAEYLAGLEGHKILIGDLNTTPWSYSFHRLVTRSGLIDSARGALPVGTWPADSWLLRVPIDHCLVSERIDVERRRVGQAIGSDHFPLVVDLQITE